MGRLTKPLFLGRLRHERLTSNQMVGQYDVNYPIKQCNLDGVINVCKYPHYSKKIGSISTMQWRTAEQY